MSISLYGRVNVFQSLNNAKTIIIPNKLLPKDVVNIGDSIVMVMMWLIFAKVLFHKHKLFRLLKANFLYKLPLSNRPSLTRWGTMKQVILKCWIYIVLYFFLLKTSLQQSFMWERVLAAVVDSWWDLLRTEHLLLRTCGLLQSFLKRISGPIQ